MLPQEDAELEIDPDPALEREAEEAAQRAMEGGPVTVNRMGAEMHVQRMGGPYAGLTDADSSIESAHYAHQTANTKFNTAAQLDDLLRANEEVSINPELRESLDDLDPTKLRAAVWFVEGFGTSLGTAGAAHFLTQGLDLSAYQAETIVGAILVGGSNAARKELNHRDVYLSQKIAKRFGAEGLLVRLLEKADIDVPWDTEAEYK